MKSHKRKLLLLIFAVLLTGSACTTVLGANTANLVQPEPYEEDLFNGIHYQLVVKNDPRPMVIHIVTIDLNADGIKPVVTRPDSDDPNKPLNARTTSSFLKNSDLELAINGDAFATRTIGHWITYPNVGDPVDPTGYAMSWGDVYSESPDDNLPILYFDVNGLASINRDPGNGLFAIGGTRLLVDAGEAVSYTFDDLAPRTAVGVNQGGTTLTIIIVDGRMPGYSEGASFNDLAGLMLEHNVWDAMSLDGGGSTTLVIKGDDGEPLVLNTPTHQRIPGTERPVANHIGFHANK